MLTSPTKKKRKRIIQTNGNEDTQTQWNRKRPSSRKSFNVMWRWNFGEQKFSSFDVIRVMKNKTKI